MKDMMDDFRKFALEKFGKEIYFKKSDKIDTFESLFGASFVGKDELRIGVNMNTYSDSRLNISLDLEYNPVEKYDLQHDIALAA